MHSFLGPICIYTNLSLVFQDLRNRITQCKALLDALENTGRDIINESNEDPRVVRDIRGELNKLTSPLDVVARKVQERQAKLQGVLLQCQEFQVSCDDFLGNVGDLEAKISSEDPISAVLGNVRKQKQENEAVQNAIEQQKHVLEKLLNDGEAVIENLEDDAEKTTLKNKIDDMKDRFDAAKQQNDDRQSNIEKVEKFAQKYRSEADSVASMLATAEDQVEAFAPLSSDKTKLAKQKELLDDIQAVVEKLKSNAIVLKENASDLMEDAAADKDVVKDEVDDLVTRIDNLNAALDDRSQKLTMVQQAAEDYHVTVAEVEDVFASAYDDVDAPAFFGVDTDKAAEQLSKIKVRLVSYFEASKSGIIINRCLMFLNFRTFTTLFKLIKEN